MRGVDVDGRQESSEETRAARGAIVQTLGKRGWTVGDRAEVYTGKTVTIL